MWKSQGKLTWSMSKWFLLMFWISWQVYNKPFKVYFENSICIIIKLKWVKVCKPRDRVRIRIDTTSHHWALIDVSLRICPCVYLQRIMVHVKVNRFTYAYSRVNQQTFHFVITRGGDGIFGDWMILIIWKERGLKVYQHLSHNLNKLIFFCVCPNAYVSVQILWNLKSKSD